jgi:hypothetical protein
MKTIFDAVNEFEAAWPNKSYDTIWVSKHDSDEAFKFGSIVTDDTVCTADEFNALVSDFENWQPTPSVSPLANVTYAEYKEKFMSESKHALATIGGDGGKDFTVKNETAELKGVQYEIGKWYEFSNDGDNWDASKLDAIEGSNFAFLTSLGWMQLCREATLSLGTITPAPVEFVDGAVYEFTCFANKLYGEYSKSFHRFYNGDQYYSLGECTNITRLVPEVKL